MSVRKPNDPPRSGKPGASLASGLLALLLLLIAPPAGASDHVEAELLVDGASIEAGRSFPVGVRLRIDEGWHVYWRNPGDSGLPTTVDWELPPGYEAGPLLWPTPEHHTMGSVINFGYEEEVILLADVEAPQELRAGDEVPVQAEVSWLVCREACIPGRATLQGKAVAGAGADEAAGDEGAGAALEEARTLLPVQAPWESALRNDDEAIVLELPAPELREAQPGSLFFFPQQDRVVEHAAEQKLVRTEGGVELHLEPSVLATERPERLDGVLVLEEELGDGVVRQGFSLSAQVAPAPATAAAAAGATGDTPDGAAPGLWQVLVLALLGGVILNLMPCVFPVLSLKVLGVAQQASEAPARIRLHGLAYTAGILASFALLAGLLLALRAAGAEIGWGFQLQSPAFVTVLAYVLLAMALSLSGVLHFGGAIAGVGSSLASRPGLPGSFFTGVLATVVATPCTAPFMGAAVGYAILQPAAVALGIFLALGFGLALPFLVLSFVPALHRLLPRPGAWMERLKQALAFPLYGTVAWLVWVLEQQSGSQGLAAALAGLVLVGFGAWAWGVSRGATVAMRRVGGVFGLGSAVAALLLVQIPSGGASERTEPELARGQQAERWSEERQEALLAEGRPVFVNFTAAWCVTCLVNERNALATEGVQAAFAEGEVAYLKGDWTNRDPAITRMLERFGRSGVPLYLLYDGRGGEPQVLPQLLTEAIVREHLEKL